MEIRIQKIKYKIKKKEQPNNTNEINKDWYENKDKNKDKRKWDIKNKIKQK